jgi:hypothetical protein
MCRVTGNMNELLGRILPLSTIRELDMEGAPLSGVLVRGRFVVVVGEFEESMDARVCHGRGDVGSDGFGKTR